MESDYSVVYRKVQHPRLEFKTGELLLILPEEESKEKILLRYSSWIAEKKKIIREALLASEGKKICNRPNNEFRTIVNKLINQYSDNLGVKPHKVFFRKMNSKWASCSINGNITVNVLLNNLPDNLLSYVIYHEMVHLIEKRHNIMFWNKIEEKFPDWKILENDLFIYWFLVQKEDNLEKKVMLR